MAVLVAAVGILEHLELLVGEVVWSSLLFVLFLLSSCPCSLILSRPSLCFR